MGGEVGGEEEAKAERGWITKRVSFFKDCSDGYRLHGWISGGSLPKIPSVGQSNSNPTTGNKRGEEIIAEKR
jgi:hypothetical protein